MKKTKVNEPKPAGPAVEFLLAWDERQKLGGRTQHAMRLCQALDLCVRSRIRFGLDDYRHIDRSFDTRSGAGESVHIEDPKWYGIAVECGNTSAAAAWLHFAGRKPVRVLQHGGRVDVLWPGKGFVPSPTSKARMDGCRRLRVLSWEGDGVRAKVESEDFLTPGHDPKAKHRIYVFTQADLMPAEAAAKPCTD
jgi:hypothetical protein